MRASVDPGNSRGASLAVAALIVLSACSEAPRETYQGYAEGEFVHVASPYAGQLEKLSVARGQQVEASAPLFVLERAMEQGAVDAAAAKIRSAEGRIENLSVGRRKPELDTLRAQADSAAAASKLARIQLDQYQRLYDSGFVSQGRLDEARATYEREVARVKEMEAQMRTGLQSLGRQPEIESARADFEAARAELAQARVRLEQKTGTAPAAALVQDTYFREGEWVPAGTPVVSLLPPANIKVRFFVPEQIVGTLRAGQPVSLACDGCGAPIEAKITYISPQAEYTPPVIYSRESRAKLLFLVEARPAPADGPRLHPGQPVDVTVRQS